MAFTLSLFAVAALLLLLQGDAAMLRAALGQGTSQRTSQRTSQQTNLNLNLKLKLKNPIRPVIDLLQKMRQDIEDEGTKAQELYDKFNCQCSKSRDTLLQESKDAKFKIERLEFKYREEFAEKGQLEKAMEEMKKDRDAAEEMLKEAQDQRTKEEEKYDAKRKEDLLNLNAMTLAIKALEEGMGSGKDQFLQVSSNVQFLKNMAEKLDMSDADRNTLTAFMSTGNGQKYEPASGEIVGILKHLKDELAAEVDADEKAEMVAKVNFNALQEAKQREIDSLSDGIRIKGSRIAELMVDLQYVINEIESLKQLIQTNTKILEDRIGHCNKRKDEHQEAIKSRYAEVDAIQKAIKVLNEDAALDLFKKTLEPAANSFLQMEAAQKETTKRAVAALNMVANHDIRLNLIAMSLKGKKVSFVTVLKHIDEMIGVLKEEYRQCKDQAHDCGTKRNDYQFKLHMIRQKMGEIGVFLYEHQNILTNLGTEKGELADAIKTLQKEMADAKEQRDLEKKNYAETLAMKTQALSLLNEAKTELGKFYEKDAYVAELQTPAAAQVQDSKLSAAQLSKMSETQQDELLSSYGDSFLQVSSKYEPHAAHREVIGYLDAFINDLDRDMSQAKAQEDDDQKDYDDTEKANLERIAESQGMIQEKTRKENEISRKIAQAEGNQETLERLKADTEASLEEIMEKCQFLLKNYDTIQTARKGEIDSLTSAKNVLSAMGI